MMEMAEVGKDLDMGKEGKEGMGASAEDFEHELATNTSAFEALERDFQEVLSELMGDQSLEKFRLEYEKLHRALKKSHEQEKRLVKKCRELNSEILNNQAKIKTALRLSQEDQKTISHLQKEMEKTWKLVNASQEKETKAKETIQALKDEMSNLSKLVERGAGLSINQENMAKELRQAKEELERQLEEQSAQLEMIENQLIEQHKVQEELRGERDVARKMSVELRERLASKESENARELRRREKMGKELQEVRMRLDEKEKDELKLVADVRSEQAKKAEVDRQLSDSKATMDKCLRDYEALATRTSKLSEDLETQVTRNKRMVEDALNAEKEMKFKVMEVGRLRTDNDVLERRVEKEKRSVLHYQQLLEDTKTPLQMAHAEIESLKADLIAAHRQESLVIKEKEKVAREKEQQLKATHKAEMRTKEQIELLGEQERATQSVSSELQESRIELQRLRKAIYTLEIDRERLGQEVQEQRGNYIKAEEEVKVRETQIADLVRRVGDWEAKLKQQQQLYENVRADRNQTSKALVEAQDEIAELRKKFKIMNHQVEQLKEEISSKDQAVIREHYEYQKAEKVKENVQNELNRKNQLIAANHELIHQQDGEMKRLTSAIRSLDEESLAQRKEYDQVINERDILGTQLIRRNDELALLYEKLRVQQSALKAGEYQYAARLDDVRILKTRLKDLTREVAIYKNAGGHTEEMRREVLSLQRELLQERTKVTALSEELENPMNVHRWRKLEGSDPATFELIQKIQTLQRRLISKTEEVVEKGLIIQEKEKLYVELKAILARQPGPEMAEQLTVYQQSLKNKTRQLKAMASELNMYQAQANEYKYEIERLSRELQEMKRKYYQQKRKDAMVKEMELEGMGGVMSKTAPQLLQNEQVVAAKSARTRFAGGGFAIQQPGKSHGPQ